MNRYSKLKKDTRSITEEVLWEKCTAKKIPRRWSSDYVFYRCKYVTNAMERTIQDRQKDGIKWLQNQNRHEMQSVPRQHATEIHKERSKNNSQCHWSSECSSCRIKWQYWRWGCEWWSAARTELSMGKETYRGVKVAWTDEQKKQDVMNKKEGYKDIFQEGLGKTSLEHHITLTSYTHVHRRPYAVPSNCRESLKSEERHRRNEETRNHQKSR